MRFIWNDDGATAIATIDGYTVTARVDTNCRNPLADDDGAWPMLCSGNRDYDVTRYGGFTDALAMFTDGQIIHWQRAIADAVNADLDDIRLQVVGITRADRAAILLDCLRESFNRDDVDQNATLLGILRVPYHRQTWRGYSQGEWQDVLIVAPSDVLKRFGLPQSHDVASGMRRQFETWSDWARGNCYGYTVTHDATIDDVGSCWGFVGDDMERSGLADMALSEIDSDKRTRAETLASIYRSRFPATRQPRKIYQCGICDHWHDVGFAGDCRDDDARFIADEIGKEGIDWIEVEGDA